jgi:hypothetical protein
MRIQVRSPSDGQLMPDAWRDGMIRHEVAEAARAAGHDIAYAAADTNLWLWGGINSALRDDQRHVVWVVSHPNAWLGFLGANPDAKPLFTKAFCASESLTRATESFGIAAEYLPCPAPRRPAPLAVSKEYDLAFVGNSAAAKGRDTLRAAFNKFRSFVVGQGWGEMAQQPYIDWKEIASAVSKACLYVHTSYPDMRNWSVMPDNVLDAAANSTALAVHDSTKAAEDLPLCGPTFETADELVEICSSLLGNRKALREAEEAQRAEASKFVGFESAVERIFA